MSMPWMAQYDNPVKPVVQAVREVILKADKRIGETIKWQAPTLVYKGNLASFFPRAKQHASLMFHQGASIKGDFPSFEGGGDRADDEVRGPCGRDEEVRRAQARGQGMVRPKGRRLTVAPRARRP